MTSLLRSKIKEKDLNKIMESINAQTYLKPVSGDRLDVYWLIKPFARAIIKKDNYILEEPKLNENEYILLEVLYRKLRDKIILKNEPNFDNKDIILFAEFINEVKKSRIDITTIGKIWYYLRREFLGYGKLDPIFKDPYIEDISCSGYSLPVYVYHRIYGSLRTNILFEEDELDKFVLKLAQKANTQVSLESPIADSTLPTGERIQVTYRKVASTRGSTFSIRKTPEEPITVVDLVAWNTVDSAIAALIWLCVESRLNMLITGSTASGKTTMLNAVSLFIPKNTKIISIEDTREVRLPHENWTPFLVNDSDEMFEMLKTSLRQRPEFLLVGEIRGKEAITMFQAMNTGHTTYSTLHAGDADSAVNRLIYDPINVPLAMFDALDLLMVLKIDHIKGNMVRRMVSLYMIDLVGGTQIRKYPLFMWSKSNDRFIITEHYNMLVDRIARTFGKSRDFVEDEIQRRSEFIGNLLVERPNMYELMELINNYREEFYERL